jgi:hypothetical protein
MSTPVEYLPTDPIELPPINVNHPNQAIPIRNKDYYVGLGMVIFIGLFSIGSLGVLIWRLNYFNSLRDDCDFHKENYVWLCAPGVNQTYEFYYYDNGSSPSITYVSDVNVSITMDIRDGWRYQTYIDTITFESNTEKKVFEGEGMRNNTGFTYSNGTMIRYLDVVGVKDFLLIESWLNITYTEFECCFPYGDTTIGYSSCPICEKAKSKNLARGFTIFGIIIFSIDVGGFIVLSIAGILGILN